MFSFKERRTKKFVRRVKSSTDSKHKFALVMNEFKRGKLNASAGYKVTNPAQARAIAYSMAYGKKKMRSNRKVESKKPQKQGLLSKLKSFIGR